MTTEKNEKTILIMDDEPHNLVWMKDFLENKGFSIEVVTNLKDCLEVYSTKPFRALILDLEVPVSEHLEAAVQEKGAAFSRYPGLFMAWTARNAGYRDRQVIVYSVHRNREVTEVIQKIGGTYIIKGRPQEIKQELLAVLSYDPNKDKPK